MKIKLEENKDQKIIKINTIFIICRNYEYAKESYIFVKILLVFFSVPHNILFNIVDPVDTFYFTCLA